MRLRTNVLIVLSSLSIAGVLCIVGCAQNTEAPVEQETQQELFTPASTETDAATQGSNVNIWVTNAPARGAEAGPGGISLDPDSAITFLTSEAAGGDAPTLEGTNAGYVQIVSLTVNTGSTTPTLSGTTSATGTATQSPAANATANPTQDVRPEASVAAPIGVAMPGGMVDQQAVATGEGQTTGTEKQSENELRWTKIEALADKLDKLMPLIESLLNTPADPPKPPQEP